MSASEQLEKLTYKVRQMEMILKIVANWGLPNVIYQGKEVSYEHAYGAEGAKRYLQRLAAAALEDK